MTRFVFSKTSLFPATIETSLPSRAAAGPPIRGIPSISISFLLRASALYFDCSGEIVLESATTRSLWLAAIIPSVAKHIFFTASKSVTHIKRKSRSSASAVWLLAIQTPIFLNFLFFPCYDYILRCGNRR
jgi:hypothetical protein